MNNMFDPYLILGLSRDATSQEIENAFNIAPRTKSTEAAYQVLIDESLRRLYDSGEWKQGKIFIKYSESPEERRNSERARLGFALDEDDQLLDEIEALLKMPADTSSMQMRNAWEILNALAGPENILDRDLAKARRQLRPEVLRLEQQLVMIVAELKAYQDEVDITKQAIEINLKAQAATTGFIQASLEIPAAQEVSSSVFEEIQAMRRRRSELMDMASHLERDLESALHSIDDTEKRRSDIEMRLVHPKSQLRKAEGRAYAERRKRSRKALDALRSRGINVSEIKDYYMRMYNPAPFDVEAEQSRLRLLIQEREDLCATPWWRRNRSRIAEIERQIRDAEQRLGRPH